MFHEPGVFIKQLDSLFAKKIMLVWGPSEPQRCRQQPTLSLYYVEKMKETIFSETSCAYKGQQQLTIDFYFHFLTNFQT